MYTYYMANEGGGFKYICKYNRYIRKEGMWSFRYVSFKSIINNIHDSCMSTE